MDSERKILGSDYEVFLYACDYEGFLGFGNNENEIDWNKFNIESDEGPIKFYHINFLDKQKVLDNIPILVPLLYSDNGYEYVLDYRNAGNPQIVAYKGNDLK